MNQQVKPSPEVKAVIKAWCDEQQAKYGDGWKKVLAAKMAEEMRPTLERLDRVLKTKRSKGGTI